MISKIEFPAEAGRLRPDMLERYYNTYYRYVLKIFAYGMGQGQVGSVVLTGDTAVADAVFTVLIDGVCVAFDYSDHLILAPDFTKYQFYFKFHYVDGHKKYPNVYPFSPVSFYDWGRYYELSSEIKYSFEGSLIVSAQKPYGNAVERRVKVQKLLKGYDGNTIIGTCDQEDYWRLIDRALVHVFVPGCRPDMLDRGQAQYLAFGCCTISPTLTNILPYGEFFKPNVHYLMCDDKYSNVIKLVDWCKANRQECVAIGGRAKQMFREVCTPEAILKWVELVMKGEVKLSNAGKN